MHHCLHVPDIVLLLFKQVSSSDTVGRAVNASNDQDACKNLTRPSQLLALAQTCREFQQPALASLWEEIEGITPVIKCAGRDLWKVHTERFGTALTLARAITSFDVEIMKKYAALVRKIEGPHERIDSDVWRALRDAFSGTVLFPSLQHIIFDSEDMAVSATLFGAQNLASLSINTTEFQPPLVEFFAQCSRLTNFGMRQVSGPLQQAIIEAIPHWPYLSQFTSVEGSSEIIHAISTCPRLQFIRFMEITSTDWQLLSPTANANLTAFPVLEKIEFGTYYISDAALILDGFPATCRLQDLVLCLLCVHDSDELLTYFFRSLRQFSHSMKKITIEEHYTNYPRVLPMTFFSLLATNLSGLTHISIYCQGDYHIGDQGIKSFTESLPKLEDFALRYERRSLNQNLCNNVWTTIACLTSFAQNCPLLSHLSIAFAASETAIPEYSDPLAQGLRLTSLDVSISSICSDSNRVAAFILCTFPNIQQINWAWLFYGNVEADSSISWSKVSKFLKDNGRLFNRRM